MKKRLFILGIVFSLVLCGCWEKEGSGSGFEEIPGSSSQAVSSEPAENADSAPEPDESVPPMDEESFTEEQRRLINLAKSFYIARLELSEEITETEKGDFFRYIISTSWYADRVESWKRDGEYPYAIPLSEVKEILFSRLDTQSFDPEQGFPEEGPAARYDPEREEYLLPMIGGYGGAAALGVLEYEEEGDAVHILLGSYDMNLFYSQTPSYVLTGTYEVTYSVSSGWEDFKVLKIQRN